MDSPNNPGGTGNPGNPGDLGGTTAPAAPPDRAPRATPDRPTPENLTRMTEGRLPGLLGFRVVAADERSVTAELDVRPDLLAPNGYLHAATVVALADTACGIGCRLSLPDGASGFTTVQLTSSYTGTAREGTVRTVAALAHRGRRTQVWDAVVSGDSGRTIALVRCTQMIIWP
ncbi:PaaI family thioesterase [Streptosporangium sp. NBC_01755]|uniref:PaaI family thioesterase n=1 Tax=Streptosporangium sp. NBC_01755 TaxID=2975949 RepID=UPI002DD7DD5B|nr:PaaI family thioesterase [Streptosporangium sp. NBC_01755]WSC99344.1 PaaI family thioesterase [Streptosporangium sp. NBC_01755]